MTVKRYMLQVHLFVNIRSLTPKLFCIKKLFMQKPPNSVMNFQGPKPAK